MTSEGPGEFATLLRRFRQAAALSQEELGEKASLTAKAVGALERGERRRPYPNTVRALADALELDAEERAALVAAARPGAGGSDPGRPARRAAVPRPPNRLLGRDRELAEVVALLRSGVTRLVTLTGPGGVGKTRLAWEVAGALLADGDAEPVAVELAPLTSADLVLPTIARSIGLHAATGDLRSAVAEFLGDSAHVLVLDNLEHLRDAAPDVAELLGRCAGLVVLATSRAPLRIRAEQEYPLAPLALPVGDDVDTVAWSPAGQLFADRARAVAPDFVIDQRTAPAVRSICAQLDGLPLALEFAAAHVRYLTPDQLLSRLDDALDSPTQRDLPDRQRTLRAMLGWSYELLTGEEQALLRTLWVFRGGFEFDAVEAVAADEGIRVMPALEGLVEQSLVTTAAPIGPRTPPRQRLLEPVRHYAAALVDKDATAAVAARHARHYAALCHDARAGLRSRDLGAWPDRLEGAHENLRATLDTLTDTGQHDAAARLGADTWLYWALRGHAGEGLRWWARLLDMEVAELDQRGRASAYLTLAGLRLATGDVAGVRAMAEPAVGGARALSDPVLLAEALNLWCIGTVFAGHVSGAAAGIEELLWLVTEIGDPWLSAHARTVEGQALLLRGESEASGRALAAAEETARGGELPFTLATVLNMQATLALQVGDDDAALRHLVESVHLAAEVGTMWTLVYTLPALGGLAARRGDAALAVTLFAAGSAAAQASLLAVSFRPDAEAADAQLEAARQQLSEEELRRAWEHGRSLDIVEVLELLPQLSGSHGPG